MKRTKTFQTGRPGTAELNSATADYFRDVAAMPDLFNDIFIQIDAHKKINSTAQSWRSLWRAEATSAGFLYTPFMRIKRL